MAVALGGAWWIATSGRDGKTNRATARQSLIADEMARCARNLLPSCSEITIHLRADCSRFSKPLA
jgi:hypothetical protein